MTYEETLAKIESYQRFSGAPGLERMAALLARLGNPQDGLKFVHVAGTNGKGTTCALVASVLTAAGYRAGLYQSPHVCDFRERMQISGAMITREELVSAAERASSAADALERDGVRVNFFELVTAAAMVWFAEKKCDLVVLEVGLGGRFDATNVIREPLVSVITSISLDHTKILGDTVEQIAREKCGIFKPGCPAVCSPCEPEGALDVIRAQACERGCPLTEASANSLFVLRSGLSGTEAEYHGQTLKLPFLGAHQVRNAATALAALEILRAAGWNIPPAALAQGFAEARLPARLEVLSADPPVLLDGAHNPDGTAALAAALREYLAGRKITAVMGMMADKDVAHAVLNLAGIVSQVITVTPHSPRAMEAETLAGLWRRNGVPAQAADLREALALAFSALEPGGALVICGSFYLAGDMRAPALEAIRERCAAQKAKK